MTLYVIVLLILALIFFRFGVIVLFISRGVQKTQHKANDVTYTLEELYEIGSPFNSFEGFTNF